MKRIILSSNNIENESLKFTEKQIKNIYYQAQTELELELQEYLDQFFESDTAKQNELNDTYKKYRNGIIAYVVYKTLKTNYEKWRINQIMTGVKWENIKGTLANSLLSASLLAENEINSHIFNSYYLNYNQIIYQFEKGALLAPLIPIYSKKSLKKLLKKNSSLLPQYNINKSDSIEWNKKKITSAIMQGILKGESIPKIAKRIRKVANMNYNASIRNARTASGAAANKARLDSFNAIQKKGFTVKKRWISMVDNKTRHEHRLLMGQTINLNESFKINGYEIKYPCDPEAAPEMIYNCRCSLVGIIEGYENVINAYQYNTNPNLNGMTLEEWQNSKSIYE